MHLSGQLTDWSINDLLQIMQVTQKTGSLDIEGDRHGRIHFRDGTVTGAELTGDKGSFLGGDRATVADILYVLSTLTEGSFAVGPADGPETSGWDVEDVLADVGALQSLEGEVAEAGLFDAAAVRFTRGIDSTMKIEPEDWSTMVSFIQAFTFDQLQTKLGRGGAVRVLHTLHRLGLAEPIVEAEEEADWLDRLAEGMSSDSSEPTWLEHDSDEEASPDEAIRDEEEPADPETFVEVVPAAATDGVVESADDLVFDDHVEAFLADADPKDVQGVSAPADTTLTDGVYDEIRRLRSKVAEK